MPCGDRPCKVAVWKNVTFSLKVVPTPHATTLEDYVTGHGGGTDTLATRHAAKRDAVAIDWLREAVDRATPPLTVLDVGCRTATTYSC